MTEQTVWYTRCPLPTAFSVALHTGRVEASLGGLGLQSLRHSADPAIRLAHFTHTLPGMMRHGGHIPPLWARAEGRDVRLLGLSWTEETQLVLTLSGSGIAGAADLKGRRLAIPVRPNSPIDFWRATVLRGFQSALATAGLTLDDVVLVEIPVEAPAEIATPSTAAATGVALHTLSSQREEAFALLQGKVDALYSPGHYGVGLRAFLGARTVIDVAAQPDRRRKINNSSLLAFTVEGSFLDANRPAVRRILVSVLEAADWARHNPAEVGRIIAAESGNPEELVGDIFGSRFAEGLDLTLEADALEILEQQNAFLHQHGFIPRQVPHTEWIEPTLLAEAREIHRHGTDA